MFPPLIDTHWHPTNGRFATDVEAVLTRAGEAGFARLIGIGTGLADARALLALRAQHPELLYAAAGLDPFTCHQVGEEGFAAELAALDSLLAEGHCIAVGECGLEYHHAVLPRPVQARQFAAQLELARRRDLPVVVHIRDAHDDAIALLGDHRGVRGVIHSFSGGPAEAQAYLDLGWHLSFNGILTYKANDALRAAAALTPNDRLLIETDAPYLAPQAQRGRRNEPAFARYVLDLLADLRGQRGEDVAAWTTQNAVRLFALPACW